MNRRGKEPPVTTTLAITTTAALAAGIPACDFCDANMAVREIGEGVYLMEIRHDLGCLIGLACYEKADHP